MVKFIVGMMAGVVLTFTLAAITDESPDGLEYDEGFDAAVPSDIEDLFRADTLTVEKKGKNGMVEQNLIPMIRRLTAVAADENTIRLDALICCQNPTLNPTQLVAAIEKYLPHCKPDHAVCCRKEIYDTNETIFR